MAGMVSWVGGSWYIPQVLAQSDGYDLAHSVRHEYLPFDGEMLYPAERDGAHTNNTNYLAECEVHLLLP